MEKHLLYDSDDWAPPIWWSIIHDDAGYGGLDVRLSGLLHTYI